MVDFVAPASWMLIGLAVLVGGGELLVRGAVALSVAVRVSPLVIGLTVVAFGTSAPELAVSVRSALAGSFELAIGNVVGSNIANILLILGLSALVSPLVVSSKVIREDVPLMIVASGLLLAMAWDGVLSRLDGALLVVGLVTYTSWSLWESRRETKEVVAEFAEPLPTVRGMTAMRLLLNVAIVLGGLALLTIGARWLVDGAVDIARLCGLSELIIGLTIVALGTSLPELVTSLVASIKGQRDIAVGNVVGSNLFNILCVLGVTSLLIPNGIPVSTPALHFDVPVMIAVAIACLPIFFTGNRIARWEGALFLSYYVAYITYVTLAAVNSVATHAVGVVMIGFVIPLTAMSLLICTWRAARHRRRGETTRE